jgi:hypothetical protein
MQINFIAVYLAFLSSQVICHPTSGVSCGSNCPVYIQAQGICFSDGNLYTDSCRAACADPKISSLFGCNFPFNTAEAARCDAQCKTTVKNYDFCVSKCPIYFRKNTICASNGKLYMDECRAKCVDKNLLEVMNCNLLDDAVCLEKCQTAINESSCGSSCPVFIKKNTICASDGNLYESECKAQCHDTELVELFNCGNKSDKSCKDKCIEQFTINSCQNKCPKLRRRLMYWCANNGIVYDDLCKAQCISKSIEFLWNCEDKNILTNNKPLCDKVCKASVMCPDKCNPLPTQWVCASNGKLYRNGCEAECAGRRVLKVLKPNSDLQKQKAKCKVKAFSS